MTNKCSRKLDRQCSHTQTYTHLTALPKLRAGICAINATSIMYYMSPSDSPVSLVIIKHRESIFL